MTIRSLEPTCARGKAPDNERAAAFLANFSQALSHPDADDLEKLQMRIRDIFTEQKA